MSGAGVDRPIPFAPPTPSNIGDALLPNLSLLLRNLAFTVGVPGTVSVLVPLPDPSGRRSPAPSRWVAGAGADRRRARALRVVYVALRDHWPRHARTLGRAPQAGGGRAVPLGPQPDLRRRPAGHPGRGLALWIVVARHLRRRSRGFLPPRRPRLRRANAPGELPGRLRGLFPHRLPLDSPPARSRLSERRPVRLRV